MNLPKKNQWSTVASLKIGLFNQISVDYLNDNINRWPIPIKRLPSSPPFLIFTQSYVRHSGKRTWNNCLVPKKRTMSSYIGSLIASPSVLFFLQSSSLYCYYQNHSLIFCFLAISLHLGYDPICCCLDFKLRLGMVVIKPFSFPYSRFSSTFLLIFIRKEVLL